MDDNAILDRLIITAVDLGKIQTELKDIKRAAENLTTALREVRLAHENREDVMRVAADNVAEARRERDVHFAMRSAASNALADLVAAVDGVLVAFSGKKTNRAEKKRVLGILRERANTSKAELMKYVPFA